MGHSSREALSPATPRSPHTVAQSSLATTRGGRRAAFRCGLGLRLVRRLGGLGLCAAAVPRLAILREVLVGVKTVTEIHPDAAPPSRDPRAVHENSSRCCYRSFCTVRARTRNSPGPQIPTARYPLCGMSMFNNPCDLVCPRPRLVCLLEGYRTLGHTRRKEMLQWALVAVLLGRRLDLRPSMVDFPAIHDVDAARPESTVQGLPSEARLWALSKERPREDGRPRTSPALATCSSPASPSMPSSGIHIGVSGSSAVAPPAYTSRGLARSWTHAGSVKSLTAKVVSTWPV